MSGSEVVENHRTAVETVADERTDELGAMARVLLALNDEEPPRETDLAAAGLPTYDELGVEES